MASQQQSLPPDVQENIVHNIQRIINHQVDKKVIRAVLNRECWDLEKSLSFIKTSLESISDNPNNVKKKENRVKRANQTKPSSQKNKPGYSNTISEPNKPPALLKNFKKKTRPKNVKQEILKKPKKDTVVHGDRVMIDETNSPKAVTSKEMNKNSTSENKSQANDRKSAKRKQMIQHYEIIKQFGEPLNRISAFINEGIKVMILLRGCSGSGKTTYANQLLSKHGAKNHQSHLFSTDHFFINKEGRYVFNYENLPNAHEWNQKLVRHAVSEGRSPIFVDNTNTRLWEMKEYACMAVEFGYVIETLEPPTPWFFNEDILVRKTLHNVPRDTIKKMLDRYEANISGNDIIQRLQLNYSSLAPPQGVLVGLDIPASKKHLKLYNERFNFELPNKTQNKSIAKKNSGKPDAPNQVRLPKLMDNSEISLQFRPPANKPINNMRFQQIQPNNQMRYGGPGHFPGNSNFNPNRFIEAGNFRMQDQQIQFSQNIYNPNNGNNYNPNNGPGINAAVPNVFNSHFNGGFDIHNCTRPNMMHSPVSNVPPEYHLHSNRFNSGLLKENSVVNQPVPGTFRDPVPYVDDLIDLAIPINSENINDPKECLSSLCDVSSSISLLEGLKIGSEASLNLLEDDLDDDEEESSVEDTSASESDDEEYSTSLAYSCAQQSSEYVLITAENEIKFQKNHEELSDIKTLEDFKKTSSLLTCFPNNFEDIVGFMNSKMNVVENDNISEISDYSNTFLSMGNEDTKKEVLLRPKRRIRPTTSLGDWDYKNELPKEMTTPIPKDQRLKLPDDIKNISSGTIPTNTNYIDFEVLRETNNGVEIENTKILIGRSCFVSKHSKIPSKPMSVLMLDKGVMTSDIETSLIVVRDSGIDRLSLMFPSVSRENLEELFDRCQKDIDWTVGLLLDSGHEMSELYSSLEPIECYNYDNITSKTLVSSDMIETDNQHAEVKKKKKRGDNGSGKYKEIQEKIQSNFVLGENHYSEKMKKHIERKHNIQIGTSTEVLSTVPQGDDGLEEEITNDNITDNSDSEEDAVFMLDSDFIFQLQSRFGGLLRPNMIGEKTVVSIPSMLARQLHCCIMDSVLQQIEGEDIFISDTNKDEEFARHLQDEESKARSVPSLLEIMDEEVALRKSQVQKDPNTGRSMASTLSKQLLIERFPLMDPGTLSSILEDTNHSLHEATTLLSSAGHFPVETKQQTEQSDSINATKNTLSREEAIKQADAYGYVASKLYELRKDSLNKSQKAYREGNPSVALYYSDMARWYMERIEQSNSLAAKAILSGYEGWTTLDLHFLQVSEALNVLDLFVDEVIRGLQDSKNKKAIVYIITGRGLHSVGGLPRLKPAVQSRLSKRDLRYVEHNPGMLKVIISRTALTSYNREVATCA